MNKQKILIISGFIIFFILGMAALQFMRTVEIMTEDNLEEIQYNASLTGYNTAIYEILLETSKCEQPLPIQFNNETYNLFLVECLNLNSNQGVQNE